MSLFVLYVPTETTESKLFKQATSHRYSDTSHNGECSLVVFPLTNWHYFKIIALLMTCRLR